ncbi:NAD-dependent glutamate dehydrogenase [Tilletia horrida]|uniref:NAD-specific glutamate dehydrogenase n=1 Tax=Tilletia horrida TaxID=155126 RepID=A0AAN6G5Z4_9BASI|nr:NAD-dependent glutamate dehydrogenase [Tilletia horrida]KAK0522520.1 NAD-dependent glutamate dehydrogenase [Tilletia horrida]KAK0537516.1 NAD-dependent glutamate dehydrogenase [Tilletia horrida]KAK0549181.1 NAD-dependent glutamate dehydrogenase [Tilletia horrida]
MTPPIAAVSPAAAGTHSPNHLLAATANGVGSGNGNGNGHSYAGPLGPSGTAHLKAALLSMPSTPNRAGTPGSDHVVANNIGYSATVFAGKAEQAKEVAALLKLKGFIPPNLVDAEVNWFYMNLGIDDRYFAVESVATVADHVMALYGAKMLAYTRHSSTLDIDLEKVSEDGAVFIHSSQPGKSQNEGPQWEKRIDANYLDKSSVAKAFRLETFRSAGTVSASSKQSLRCYFLSRCQFVEPIPSPDSEAYSDICAVSDKTFLAKASENTLAMYQSVMNEVLRRQGPVIDLYEVEGSRERRIVIGYRMGTTSSFFSALSYLYHWYNLYSTRKYVEQFSNGVSIISIYLNQLPGAPASVNVPPIEHSIHQIIEEASLIYVLPDNPFFKTSSRAALEDGTPDAEPEGPSVHQATYAFIAWVFCQHFCNRLGQAYQALRKVLDETDSQHAAILDDIKKRFREDAFTRQSILEVIDAHPDLIRQLYVHFANVHHPPGTPQSEVPLPRTLSHQRLLEEELLTEAQLRERIRKVAVNAHERAVLETILLFNTCVLKTNFYAVQHKVALSFRLDPRFLPEVEYPYAPYGIFFVVGSDFRGFHCRFKDVARGGIRIVRSRNRENYSINQRMLFDEVYALAYTQQQKNKDLPEGGSKGAILPSLEANPRLCFEKYIDSILDLILPSEQGAMVDLYRAPEILFFGPDENTADCMDWTANHTRSRGAPFWKSVSTGKGQMMGGIPHDTFGMTSLSVRQYVLGIYERMGWKESEVTKVQTGGPDGDLGSNEILLSSDKTVAVIDGSGVAHDPLGLNRDELVRLARARIPIANFDASKLSKEGYIVKVEDTDLTLPSGEVVADGVAFRNSAHLMYQADLFVPCGGRPEAINVSNVGKLFNKDGKCHFDALVEGANLFCSKQARLELEKRGVILFPDASTNKGGVTSSSLEVLAGLSLTDEEWAEHMMLKEKGKPSEFYLSYVKDIQAIISKNAAGEFNALWREHEKTKKPRSVLSAELSLALNTLAEELESTDLYSQPQLRSIVLSHVFPPTLLTLVGLEKLTERVPESYLRSAFAARLSAEFVYKYGPGASHVDFYSFLNSFGKTQ